ncbi:MAG: GIY-YIG nuclease family protein [Candidatus Melainabacteria bacterium]
MDARFTSLLDQLESKFKALTEMVPVLIQSFPVKDKRPGVYLFSEGTHHLYVGRTNHVRSRWGNHCNPGSGPKSAAFAIKLARRETGLQSKRYPDFKAAFTAAKARIRNMSFRFVEEADPTRQALLEIYCAIVLETPYNDFDNH